MVEFPCGQIVVLCVLLAPPRSSKVYAGRTKVSTFRGSSVYKRDITTYYIKDKCGVDGREMNEGLRRVR